MSFGNTTENEIMGLLFNNTAVPLIGDAAGLQPSAVPGSLYLSLHTADPGEAGTQETNETTYTGYARVAVARSAAGWTLAGSSVSNAAEIAFGQCTVGTPTLTHFAIGVSAAGAGKIVLFGELDAPTAIAPNDVPTFAVGAVVATLD